MTAAKLDLVREVDKIAEEPASAAWASTTRSSAPELPPLRKAPLTYSPSITIPLTHDCPWHCAYCGYRSDRGGLISEAEIEALFQLGQRHGATEVLLMSGEMPDTLPHIREELKRRGYVSFIDFAEGVAREALRRQFLPHTNIGALSEGQLRQLQAVNISQGLMLENVDESFCREVAPEKSLAGRIKTLEAAGRARVPYTSGILIGLGESHTSRLESLRVLARLHARYGHLQEIIIQNYIPNQGARWPAPPQSPSLADYLSLISLWRELAPDVAIQIPPNLNPFWFQLLPFIDDLGGISAEGDLINPENPWMKVEVYAKAAETVGRGLKARLPAYAKYLAPGWQSPLLLRVLEDRFGLNCDGLPAEQREFVVKGAGT